MKLISISAIVALATGSVDAFAPSAPHKSIAASATQMSAVAVEDMPGVVAPTGFFDPLGFAAKANADTLKTYREAEITHGRVSMLAVVGFLVGEKVEGSSFLFDASIKGPAISHFFQVPTEFWLGLTTAIAAAEFYRANLAYVEPENVPVDRPGLMRSGYLPGDLGFDPLGLMPETEEEYKEMATKELQNGRLAMIAAAGFLAQEAVDGKGILEHLGF